METQATLNILPGKLLFTRQDLRRLGINLSNSTLLRMEASGHFPRRVRLGAHSVAWMADEVAKHIDQLARARSGETAP